MNLGRYRCCLLMIVLLTAAPGCRLLSLLPCNHTCAYCHWSPEAGMAPVVGGVDPTMQYGYPGPPPRSTPVSPVYTSLNEAAPAMAAEAAAQQERLTQTIVEQTQLVETVERLRKELTKLQSDDKRLSAQLEELQQDKVRAAVESQQLNRLLTNIRADMESLRGEIDQWRSDLSTLRAVVRDQHSDHQRALADIDAQLTEMNALYEDVGSPGPANPLARKGVAPRTPLR